MVVTTFELVILIFEIWKAMSRAVNHTDELRDRKHEVKDLRDEKENHCLSTVTHNGDDSESHASEIAVSVTDKDLGRESIVLHQC